MGIAKDTQHRTMYGEHLTPDQLAIMWAQWCLYIRPTPDQMAAAKRRVGERSMIRQFIPSTQLQLSVCEVMKDDARRRGINRDKGSESRVLVREYWRKVYKTPPQYV